MAVSRQRAQESLDGTGEATTLVEPRLELRPFCRRRQLAEPEQARHVLEADGVGQIADLVAAIVEPPRRPIHLTDGRPRGDDVLQSRLPCLVHVRLSCVQEREMEPGSFAWLDLIIVD